MKPSQYDTKAEYDAAWADARAKRGRTTAILCGAMGAVIVVLLIYWLAR